MRFNSKLVVAGIASLLMLHAGPEPFRTDINPALLYSQAFQLAPELPAADRDFLFEKDWAGEKLPARMHPLLERFDSEFRLVRQAAQSRVACDWGFDMTPGPATLLPHLARSRVISRAASLRARSQLQDGEPMAAVEDLLGALALGRNVSRDGTLISALVQIAIESSFCGTVAENFYQLPPEALARVLEGMQSAPSRGTIAACVAGEKAFFADWFERKVRQLQQENPGDDATVMSGIRKIFIEMQGASEEGQPGPADLWRELNKVSKGTSAGVLKVLADQAPLFQRAAVVMALPCQEYEQASKEFLDQARQNPIGALSFPAFTKSRAKEFMALAELEMLRAGLEYKLHGEAGLKSVMDPCGNGPFEMSRFSFRGIDRGFQLKSAYRGRGFQETLIFVEKEGPYFEVHGKEAGETRPKRSTR